MKGNNTGLLAVEKREFKVGDKVFDLFNENHGVVSEISNVSHVRYEHTSVETLWAARKNLYHYDHPAIVALGIKEPKTKEQDISVDDAMRILCQEIEHREEYRDAWIEAISEVFYQEFSGMFSDRATIMPRIKHAVNGFLNKLVKESKDGDSEI